MRLIAVGRLLLAVGTAAIILAACSEAVSITPGEGPILRTNQISIEMVSLAGDGEPLVIEFIGGPPGELLEVPCSTDYELEVDEQAEPMRIVVWELQPAVPAVADGLRDDVSMVCVGAGFPWQLTYAPVGDAPRTIVDGATEQEMLVVFKGGALAPGTLPPGWSVQVVEASDAPPPSPEFTTVRLTDGTAEVLFTASLYADAQAELDRFRSIPEPANAATPAPERYDIEVVSIRGSEALVESDDSNKRLRFAEGDYLYSLSAPESVSLETVIAIAEGLR